jgi:rod shape-determining protein MreD
MKPAVYAAVLLLILPLQATLLDRLPLGGAAPDLALALLFLIGLLTSPVEATLAGVAIGLVQDLGSASFLGFSGLTRGLVGLATGLLGTRVLDIGSPMIVLFLAFFSIAEGVLVSLFLQVTYGDVPFFTLVATRLVPQALMTSVLGLFILQAVNKKNVLVRIRRRELQKEQ